MRRLVVLALLAAAGSAGAVVPTQEVFYATDRGAFLLQGTDARHTALGGAGTVSADDPTAVLVDPGGLADLPGPAAVATRDALAPGVSLDAVAAAAPVGDLAVGAAFTLLSVGSYDQRDATGALTGSESPTYDAVQVGVAAPHPDWMGIPGSTGLAVEVVQEPWRGAVGALNAGSVVPLDGRLTVGWSAQHLTIPKDGEALPELVQIGGTYRAPAWLTGMANATYLILGKAVNVSFGAEAVPERHVALRIGYRFSLGNNGLNDATGLAAGVGFRWSGWGLDYAIRPYGDFTTSHRFSLSYAFGRGDGPAPAAATGSPAAVAPVESAPAPAATPPTATVLPAAPTPSSTIP